MLPETEKNLEDIYGKLKILEAMLQLLNTMAKGLEPEVLDRITIISTHKLKLIDEVLRLNRVENLEK